MQPYVFRLTASFEKQALVFHINASNVGMLHWTLWRKLAKTQPIGALQTHTNHHIWWQL